MNRFREWIGLVELQPPTTMAERDCVDAAYDDNRKWRGVAVFVHEDGPWTVFHDLTGHLASFTATQWRDLAQDDELIFAGYNDSVPYGQLIVIEDGHIKREFLDDQQDPSDNVNAGTLGFEVKSPIRTWVQAASYVDEDMCLADEGDLWIFSKAIVKSSR